MESTAGGLALLDHLVGADQERLREGEAECFRGLEIHHQLESSGKFDRQVGRFGAVQNLGDQTSGPPKHVLPVRFIAHQSSAGTVNALARSRKTPASAAPISSMERTSIGETATPAAFAPARTCFSTVG